MVQRGVIGAVPKGSVGPKIATTGSPTAIASLTPRPHGSASDGNANTSAAASNPGICDWFTKPCQTTRPGASRAANASSCGRNADCYASQKQDAEKHTDEQQQRKAVAQHDIFQLTYRWSRQQHRKDDST